MSASLRVLHVRNSDRVSGPERLLLDQAALAAPSLTVLLASFGQANAPHPFLDAARAQGTATHLIEQRGSYDRKLRRRLKDLVAQADPHVVVSHDYKANFLSIRAVRDRPRVSVVHGYTAEGHKVGLFEAVDRRLLKRMDAVVVVSDPLRQRLLAAGVAPDRIHLIPNGIRADRVRAVAAGARAALRSSLRIGDDELAMIALGRLSPEKGQDVLLEAMTRGGRMGAAHLILAGDGGARAVLEKRAQAAGLGDRVHFLGWRDDPWALLGAADVFVLPSRREGLPLALLEALAAGLPVIATRVGAVAEVLEDGACGRLTPPGDVDALAAAIDELLGSEDVRRELAHAGRRRIESAYDVAGQTRELESLYGSVAGR